MSRPILFPAPMTRQGVVLVLHSTFVLLLLCALAPYAPAQHPATEVSSDGHEVVTLPGDQSEGLVVLGRDGVPYGTEPDWQNDLRRQVGALQVADMNGDGLQDVVVGCYISNSYPPYTDWENLIYYNVGGELEASPSWVSADEVSTGDIQVADINNDTYPDIFAANGGASMSPSVIYWGSATGPSPVPGWTSAEPGGAWNNYAMPFDIDHDGDLDVVTANQGNSPTDPYRPLYVFFNNDGVLATVPGWQSAETSIQNFLAFADYDKDGWEDLAVSKWANFASGIYRNVAGTLQAVPVWTTGDTDTDKGVAWADVDGNTWPDLALGHDPTQLWGNDQGNLAVTWSSSATYFGHSDLRFFDVDSDGDEDLAEIHFSNGQTHVYLNDDGTLESVPSWTYDAPIVGTALAFGLINNDVWPDLVLGYSGDACVKVFYAQPPTGLSEPDLPRGQFSLQQCQPNPFNPQTAIRFTLAQPERVQLRILSVAGKEISRLLDCQLGSGEHTAAWNGQDARGRKVPSGVYLCCLEVGGQREVRTMVLAR